MPDSRPTTVPDPLAGAMCVIAKAPVAGRVKTRLCPPLTAEQACEVAWACLCILNLVDDDHTLYYLSEYRVFHIKSGTVINGVYKKLASSCVWSCVSH